MNKPARIKRSSFLCLWIVALVVTVVVSACVSGETKGNLGNTHSSVATRSPIATPTSSLLSKPVIYVALGASDAVGVGSNQPGSQGYVPLLAAHLPKGSRLINLGVSGIRLHEALSQELPLAMTTSPNLITIWLVANDFVSGVSYDSYMHDLNILLQQLHTNTHARIVMANLPDLTLLPAFSGLSASRKALALQEIQGWNAGIAAAASRYGVGLVDLFSHKSQLTAHPEYVSADGFHPSPAGYVQLADIFWEAIQGS